MAPIRTFSSIAEAARSLGSFRVTVPGLGSRLLHVATSTKELDDVFRRDAFKFAPRPGISRELLEWIAHEGGAVLPTTDLRGSRISSSYVIDQRVRIPDLPVLEHLPPGFSYLEAVHAFTAADQRTYEGRTYPALHGASDSELSSLFSKRGLQRFMIAGRKYLTRLAGGRGSWVSFDPGAGQQSGHTLFKEHFEVFKFDPEYFGARGPLGARHVAECLLLEDRRWELPVSLETVHGVDALLEAIESGTPVKVPISPTFRLDKDPLTARMLQELSNSGWRGIGQDNGMIFASPDPQLGYLERTVDVVPPGHWVEQRATVSLT